VLAHQCLVAGGVFFVVFAAAAAIGCWVVDHGIQVLVLVMVFGGDEIMESWIMMAICEALADGHQAFSG
jgi:hypothetical protein